MQKVSTVGTYLEHLFEFGRTSVSKLDAEDLDILTFRLIRETPTKLLPLLEKYDLSREVLTMLAGWMETEDEHLGYEILCKLRDLAITAFTPLIEDKIDDYARREEIAQREAKADLEHLNYQYNKQRI